ncbi:MAG: DMT family transporter [Betaproteobacteria bacterium]|nr:DMT family transporter [Betaproteobacteria bacterium]
MAALFAGATCIGTSALFVKVSEAGPIATAFWRIFLALPFLWVWALAAARRTEPAATADNGHAMMALAGVLFAGDLAVWHWSIKLTSVANATLLANLAPIFVTLAVWLFFRHAVNPAFLSGMATALVGVTLLIGADFGLGGRELAGDALGVVTAMFYGAYQITISRLRARLSTARIMAWSGVTTSAVLLPLALFTGEQLAAVTVSGWAKLIGLALVAQVVGQSLIAYAMAHLPATFSSVGLLLQPVMAAIFAWILLGEDMGALQMAGGVIVLAGIWIARRAERML